MDNLNLNFVTLFNMFVNILNIFLILGCSATITPISLDGFSFVDFYVLLASSLLIYMVTRFGGKAIINRFEGALLVAGYVAYDMRKKR